MRIVRSFFVAKATMLVALLFLGVLPVVAQKTGGGTPAPSPGTGTPSPAPSPTPTPPAQNQPTTNTPQPNPVAGISGRVMMYDGEVPTESVIIEQLCSDNSGRTEGHTDSQGYFHLILGQNRGVVDDTNAGIFTSFGQFGGMAAGTSSNNATGGGNPLSVFLDCQVRARLPGYRSSTISITGRGNSGNLIVLYPVTGIQGLTASATSSQAPKDARKAYEKGLGAVKKGKLDQAEKEFRKAVQIYPKYADAWLELGKVLERRAHYPEAREAYTKALAADPKYVYPYQQLYQIALHEQNWKDLADKTEQLLHMDPYEFPDAYYFNALAHLELKEYDAAEKSARQAVKADLNEENPKTHYLLGAILVHKKAWTEAAENFRAYLKAAPDATDKAYVETTLSQIDHEIGLAQTASPDSVAQQKFR